MRAIETVLVERELADPPTAARIARLSAGRPGAAIALARAPRAVALRGEIARRLLDLAGVRRTDRLGGVRELLGAAGDLVRALDAGSARPATAVGAGTADEGTVTPRREARAGARGGARRTGAQIAAEAPIASPSMADASEADQRDESDGPVRVPASDRRRAAQALVAIWLDIARDLALAERGDLRAVRDPALLDDLEVAVGRSRPDPAAFMGRLGRAGEMLEGNVSPELVLDVLALAWTPAGSG